MRPLVFVIMPVGSDPNYLSRRSRIDATVRALGMEPYFPLDHHAHNEVFDPATMRFEMQRASVVVADLTLERPSCYYELGVAQGVGLPTVIVAARALLFTRPPIETGRVLRRPGRAGQGAGQRTASARSDPRSLTTLRSAAVPTRGTAADLRKVRVVTCAGDVRTRIAGRSAKGSMRDAARPESGLRGARRRAADRRVRPGSVRPAGRTPAAPARPPQRSRHRPGLPPHRHHRHRCPGRHRHRDRWSPSSSVSSRSPGGSPVTCPQGCLGVVVRRCRHRPAAVRCELVLHLVHQPQRDHRAARCRSSCR